MPLPLKSFKSVRIMRLLELNNDGEFSLAKDFGDHVRRYAILSHAWGPETERPPLKTCWMVPARAGLAMTRSSLRRIG